LVLTLETDAVNDALLEPAATVTEAGTVTELLLLESATETPPAGAAAFRVTVQASVAEPTKEEPAQVSELRVAMAVPVRLTAVGDPETELLEMVSVPLAAPAAEGANCTVSVRD